MKYRLDSFYSIERFAKHDDLKYELLNLIDQAEYTDQVSLHTETNISKTDWNHSRNFKTRKWVAYLWKDLMDHVLEQYKSCGYHYFTVSELWFQQYYENSEHGWHVHADNFTNVYYVELPNSTPKTQIVCPYDQKTIIELDVKEGDTVFFPSFTMHKAPINKSKERKTIVSWNAGIDIPDQYYGDINKYATI